MMLRTISKLALACSLTTSMVAATSAYAFTPSTLQPEEVHPATLLEVVNTLRAGHYKKVTINDELSQKLLNHYLEALDPQKIYFFINDIAAFEKYSLTLDDDIKQGKLSAAYDIFNTLQNRRLDRLEFTIDQLENNLDQFDFTSDDSIANDRSEKPWITSQKSMDELWTKRTQSALLNLKLAGKTLEEAAEILLKRYKNQLHLAEQTNSEDVFQVFTNAFTEEFDPHTQYFSPRRSENFQINMSLQLEGIGAVLQNENEFTKIVRLVPAGPAEKTGQLKASDLIVGVGQGEDGPIEDVVGWRLDDVVQKIRGPKGTIVRLQVIPGGKEDNPRKTIRIERNKVKLEEQAAQKRILDVEHNGKKVKLGVITIPTFYIDFAALQRGDENYKSTTRDVERLINELKKENINGLIVDLRENGGGSLREAIELVGLFIRQGPAVQVRNPNGRVEIHGDFNKKIAYTGPVSVLINRLSASASEIFAGAMQDYNRGIVIGSQSFGKGTVQTLRPLKHGQIKLTHAKFYRISGESTQHKGVIPDITFPTLYDSDEIGESALEGALKWDKVAAARHGRWFNTNPLIPELLAKHKQRAGANPDFIFMNENVDRLNSLKQENQITLNESTLKAERDEAEQWRIDAENRRRMAKNLPPITELSDLDEELKKDSQGRPINPESEAILKESGLILLDLIDLAQQRYAAAQKKANQ